MYSTSYSCPILMNLHFLTIFLNTFQIPIHENSPSGSQLFPADKPMERHDETNSHFLQFCKCV